MATGDTLCVFFPTDGEEPGAGTAPTLDVVNGTVVLEFDTTTEEQIDFAGFMPRVYDGGGVTITVGWMADTATSGSVGWEIAMSRVQAETTNLGSDSYGSFQSASDVAPGTAGIVAYHSDAMSDGAQMDSVAAGEYFRLRLRRDADGSAVTDDMAGDAQLVFIEIKET